MPESMRLIPTSAFTGFWRILPWPRAKGIDRPAWVAIPSDTRMPDALTNTARKMGWLFACLLLLTVPVFAFQTAHKSGLPRAEKHEGRHEIDQLEEAWRIAFVKSDTAAMEALLADDFIGISPSGTLQNKEQMLSSMGSGRLHITSMVLSDRKVRFYGATAVVTSLATFSGTNAESEISGSLRYTRVYVRTAGQWKVVSFEASRIRPPAERR